MSNVHAVTCASRLNAEPCDCDATPAVDAPDTAMLRLRGMPPVGPFPVVHAQDSFALLDHPPAHVKVDWLNGSAYAISCAVCHVKEQTSSPTNANAIVREHVACESSLQ